MATAVADAAPDVPPSELARELLVAYRTGGDPGPALSALAALDDEALQAVRTDCETTLAFWINLYNAGTQRLLDERPELYESPLRFLRFFRAPCVTVAGTPLGLDDIEQGILRGRSKYGLGYLPRVFPSGFERRYRLDDLDVRIHFALNCGAGSCPAIRAYDPGAVDDQLEQATRAYLDSAVTYDSETGTVEVPQLFRWYHGDFGGKSGAVDLFRKYDVLPENGDPAVTYRPWDWSREAGKFVE